MAPRNKINGNVREDGAAALPRPKNASKPTPEEIRAFTSAKLDLQRWILGEAIRLSIAFGHSPTKHTGFRPPGLLHALLPPQALPLRI